MLNSGSGGFGSPVSLTSAAYAQPVGDLNNDGKVDLVAGGPDNTIGVLLGTGTGEFSAARYTGANGAGPAAVADYNADGKPDVAVAHFTANTVTILLQQQPVAVGGVAAPVDVAALPARSAAASDARWFYEVAAAVMVGVVLTILGAAWAVRRRTPSVGTDRR